MATEKQEHIMSEDVISKPNAGGDEAIRVEGLRKSFGTHLVLKGIDDVICKGEKVVVIP